MVNPNVIPDLPDSDDFTDPLLIMERPHTARQVPETESPHRQLELYGQGVLDFGDFSPEAQPSDNVIPLFPVTETRVAAVEAAKRLHPSVPITNGGSKSNKRSNNSAGGSAIGPIRGDSEADTGSPDYHDLTVADYDFDDQTRSRGKEGVAEWGEVLKSAKRPTSKNRKPLR